MAGFERREKQEAMDRGNLQHSLAYSTPARLYPAALQAA